MTCAGDNPISHQFLTKSKWNSSRFCVFLLNYLLTSYIFLFALSTVTTRIHLLSISDRPNPTRLNFRLIYFMRFFPLSLSLSLSLFRCAGFLSLPICRVCSRRVRWTPKPGPRPPRAAPPPCGALIHSFGLVQSAAAGQLDSALTTSRFVLFFCSFSSPLSFGLFFSFLFSSGHCLLRGKSTSTVGSRLTFAFDWYRPMIPPSVESLKSATRLLGSFDLDPRSFSGSFFICLWFPSIRVLFPFENFFEYFLSWSIFFLISHSLYLFDWSFGPT